jgi:biotin-(acetyl-CoA carboxylase) ligase
MPRLSQSVFESLYYPELDSTNEEARRRLLSSDQELKIPLIIRAGSQSAGRGSRGRNWFSPPGMGLYFSIVHPKPGVLSLKAPDGNKQGAAQPLNPDWALCTRAAGLACAQILREETGLQIQLKPINDLYVQSRKLGGILCESIFGQEPATTSVTLSQTPSCRGLITGIGINLRQSEAVEAFCRTEERPVQIGQSNLASYPLQDEAELPSMVIGANQPISLQDCLPAAVFSQWLDQRELLMQEKLVRTFAERVDTLYQRLFWEEGYSQILLAETSAIQYFP